MQYPRILILGETFRLNGGGGITLTNLFKDWPAENVGVITDLIEHTNPETGYTYYQLGNEEIKFPFPFNFIQRYFKSGPYFFQSSKSGAEAAQQKSGLVQKIKTAVRPAFDNFLNKVGLYTFFYRIKLSKQLADWIKVYNPDIIYIQPFHHRMMQFGNLLHKQLNIPYAIHIMDDSIKYINQSIFLHRVLQKRIERDFYELVSKAKVHLCISEAMANEYEKRYGKVFKDFRNPIEAESWKNIPLLETKEVQKIIYTGRIFGPTEEAFLDLCKAVDSLNRNGVKIQLDYTLDNTVAFQRKIKNFKGIRYHGPVKFSEFASFIQSYDLFFVCLNFDKNTKRYFQFSMSTRVSEGMISGVPVLIYAPSDFAISDYFEKTNSGLVVGSRDPQLLQQAILKILEDKAYCRQITKNAVQTALRDSEASIVRENFRKALLTK